MNCYPIPSQSAYRQRLDIYKRQNSEFNRLLSNKDDYSKYDLNDQLPSSDIESTTRSSRDPYKRQREIEDFSSEKESQETAEYRHRLKQRKRPCYPVVPNHRQGKRGRYRNTGRTLYDLNFYFLGYQPNRYQTYPVNTVNKPVTENIEDFSSPQNTYNSPQNSYNHYGGYDCSPNPFYQQSLFGQLFGGGYGNNGQYGGGNGQYSDYTNRPNSYPSLVGQALYDFAYGLFGYGNPNSGGGFDSPTGALSDTQGSNNNDRPVIEINVPDTIQALVRRQTQRN